MKPKDVSPSFVSFLSGIGAAAAVNLLTAIPTGDLSIKESVYLSLCSLPWFGASLAFTLMASVLDRARLKCERMTTPGLSDQEVEELRTAAFSEFDKSASRRGLAGLLLVIAGIAAIGYFKYSFHAELAHETQETHLSSEFSPIGVDNGADDKLVPAMQRNSDAPNPETSEHVESTILEPLRKSEQPEDGDASADNHENRAKDANGIEQEPASDTTSDSGNIDPN